MTLSYTEYKEYTTKQGDRWDTIAYREYGNCFKYAPLIMCNPDVPISPIIPEGTKLIIPVFETTEEKEEGLPVWK